MEWIFQVYAVTRLLPKGIAGQVACESLKCSSRCESPDQQCSCLGEYSSSPHPKDDPIRSGPPSHVTSRSYIYVCVTLWHDVAISLWVGGTILSN